MSESDFEMQYAEEMDQINQVNSIEDDNIFSTGFLFPTSTPFNKRTRKLEIPSSPGSILSPLFSNNQKTPMPSDLKVSTRKKPRFELESDDEDEPVVSGNKQGILDFDFQSLKSKYSPMKQLDVPSSPFGPSGVASSPIRQTQCDYEQVESLIDQDDIEFMERTTRTRNRELGSEFGFVDVPVMQNDLDLDPALNTGINVGIGLAKSFEPHFTRLPDTNLFQRGKSSSGAFLYFPHKQKKLYNITSEDHLLSNNITVLVEQVRADIRAEEAIRDMEQRINGLSDQNEGAEKKLWVDKWKPVEYVDLVGDEYLNRLVLHWVKQWDYCVFKKEKRPLMPSAKFKNPDKLQRPEKRILLMSGPPGLGKTTLAYVIARHCGYNIVEINASDERTAAVFKSKVINAIENKDIMNKKPNLVVIDEIDGVSSSGGDSSFINQLVQLATLRTGTHQLASNVK
jgi:hypothetical protein